MELLQFYYSQFTIPCSGGSSFAAEEADAAGEGSTVVDAVGEKVGRVDVIVDVDPVFTAR